MSRIDMRKLLLLTMVGAIAAFPAAAEQQDILSDGERVQEQINYKTESVRVDDYIKPSSASCSEYYPMTYNIRLGYDGTKFVEYTVSRGDSVKKGDVLAKFTVTGSEVQLTRMKMNLERAEEELAKGIRAREEEIARARSSLAIEKDGYEREKLELSLRKLEVALEQFVYRQTSSIETQRDALDEEIERRETNVLISPVDGVVTELTYKKVDDAVSANETLVTIYSEEVMLLRFDNTSGNFRYNMPVEVTTGSGDKKVTLTGRVVAADDAIPESERLGHAFIMLDPYDKDAVKLRSPKVTGATILLNDVLMVKRSAVTLESGKYYVSKLVDGMVQKRFVEYGMTNTTDIWILNGVSEHETLVVD